MLAIGPADKRYGSTGTLISQWNHKKKERNKNILIFSIEQIKVATELTLTSVQLEYPNKEGEVIYYPGTWGVRGCREQQLRRDLYVVLLIVTFASVGRKSIGQLIGEQQFIFGQRLPFVVASGSDVDNQSRQRSDDQAYRVHQQTFRGHRIDGAECGQHERSERDIEFRRKLMNTKLERFTSYLVKMVFSKMPITHAAEAMTKTIRPPKTCRGM